MKNTLLAVRGRDRNIEREEGWNFTKIMHCGGGGERGQELYRNKTLPVVGRKRGGEIFMEIKHCWRRKERGVRSLWK
jgi:hypothetical protein